MKDSGKKGIVIAVVLLLLLAAGGGAYVVVGSQKKAAEFKTVSESKSLESLEEYLAKNPGEASKPKVRELVHAVKFEAAMADNEVATYEKFLTEFPASPHAEAITENLDWLKSENEHSSDAYRSFTEKHPKSIYIPRAKLRIGQNDFWTKTKPTRDRFKSLLSNSAEISAAFHPQYAEYAAQLVSHELIYEAAAILAVMQFHHSAGALACLTQSLAALKADRYSGDYRAMNRALFESKKYQAKSSIMTKLDYSDVISEINDLAVSGNVEVDKKKYLLDQTGAKDVDEAAQLAKMLKYVKVTPYFVMYPDFVGECVTFLGTGAAGSNQKLLKLISALHLPQSALLLA